MSVVLQVQQQEIITHVLVMPQVQVLLPLVNTFVGEPGKLFITTSNTIIGRLQAFKWFRIRSSSNNIILASGDGVPKRLLDNGGSWQILDYGAESTLQILCFEIFVLTKQITFGKCNGNANFSR